MTVSRWSDVLARISRSQPDSLDHLLRVYDPRSAQPGADVFPDEVCQLPFAPQFKREDTVVIGVRIKAIPADPADLAAQLSTFALERDVEVIVLSDLDYSGLEQFGFRLEKISGETEAARALCERQISAFWGLEVII